MEEILKALKQKDYKTVRSLAQLYGLDLNKYSDKDIEAAAYAMLTNEHYRDKIVEQAVAENERLINLPQDYVVKEGDNLSKIAKETHTPLASLTLQVKNPNLIYVGLHVKINNLIKPLIKYNLEYKGIEAIKRAEHKGNYVIVDKKRQLFNIFNKDGVLLYSTRINTGAQHGDYNTKTYENPYTHKMYKKGNESTPAGISRVDYMSWYNGAPSYKRSFLTSTSKDWDELINPSNNDGWRDTPSSIHIGSLTDRGSNGCIRMSKQALIEIGKYITPKETLIYTLPENAGSDFILKGKDLSFVADNPHGLLFDYRISQKQHMNYYRRYGKDWESHFIADNVKPEDKQRYQNRYGNQWLTYLTRDYKKSIADDYFSFLNRTYHPIDMITDQSGERRPAQELSGKIADDFYEGKVPLLDRVAPVVKEIIKVPSYLPFIGPAIRPVLASAETALETITPAKRESRLSQLRNKNKSNVKTDLINNKRAIMREFGLTSSEYNNIAGLVLGLSEQETKFGSSSKYLAKNQFPELTKKIKEYRGNNSFMSEGITQIKYDGDSADLKKIYSKYGINSKEDVISNPTVATLLRLSYMYKNEVKGRSFKRKDGLGEVSPWDALLYIWMGRKKTLLNDPTPELNTYINNVNKYKSKFNIYGY